MDMIPANAMRATVPSGKTNAKVVYWDEVSAVPVSALPPQLGRHDDLSGSIDFDLLARAGHFPAIDAQPRNAFGL